MVTCSGRNAVWLGRCSYLDDSMKSSNKVEGAKRIPRAPRNGRAGEAGALSRVPVLALLGLFLIAQPWAQELQLPPVHFRFANAQLVAHTESDMLSMSSKPLIFHSCILANAQRETTCFFGHRPTQDPRLEPLIYNPAKRCER